MQTSKNINKSTIRHFWKMSQFERGRLVLILIFIPLNTLCLSTIIPLYVGKILAALVNQPASVTHYVWQLSLFAFIGVLANYIGFKAFLTFQPKIMQRLEVEALETLLNRSVGFHNNRIAGKLVSEAGLYAGSYMQLTNTLLTTIVPIVVSLVTGIIVVLANSILLGVLVMVMTVSVIWVGLWQTSRGTENRNRRHAARRAMVAHQADVITNSVTVKTFAREHQELSRGHQLSSKLANLRIQDWSRAGRDGSLRIGFLLLFEVAYIVLIIHLVQRDPALLAIGIFTFGYVINLTNRLFDIGTIFRSIEDSLLDASDIMAIITTQPEIVDELQATTLEVTEGTIDLQNIEFHYEDANHNEQVFKNLNLSIRPGEKVGLVGPSGGGKSTLTRLLLRFDDIQGGQIAIDGQNIATITQASLRKNISYVPQEPLLFHRSVQDNIAYGHPEASLDEIKKATEMANAHDFIQSLPDGYDTIVGERGVKLSGGQRQRVAIARAILKNAPILLLDEATSALDSESERLVQDALWKLIEGKTAILIAHRLSTIQRMDRIVVLDKGQIVEQGTHTDLLQAKGLYSKLWAHQSGGFIEE